MTIEINATVTVARTRVTETQLDTAIDMLGPHDGAVFRDSTGRYAATVTVSATTLAKGTVAALSLVGAALDAEPVTVEAMPQGEYHERVEVAYARRQVPDVVTVEDAATKLGVTRQAVLKRIKSKSLPAQLVGTKYVIPRASLRNDGAIKSA